MQANVDPYRQPATPANTFKRDADIQLFTQDGPQYATHAHIHDQPYLYEQPHLHGAQAPLAKTSSAAQYDLSPDVIAAIARALSDRDGNPPRPLPSTKKYFSRPITNATSDLPTSVIKEFKAGFKNYIPLALCTHKACTNATRHTDAFDTEIGWTDKGEMRLKQKSMSPAKDHYLTTDDFTEIRENFVRGMRRYLVMSDQGEEAGPGGERALACADMFADFFSVIAARPDYTQDWPSYRGYIIESYISWVGRRDDSYGLIFDEQLFYKHKMTHLVPVILEQLRQPLVANGGAVSGRGGPGGRGRGRGSSSNPGRGGFYTQPFPPPFPPQQPTSTFRCYLCGGTHPHREHQGPALRLVTNDQGKWVDKSHGSKIVCISFNVGSAGCKRGTICPYHHSCSFCGDLSHGSAKCSITTTAGT
jgi:hypothetical protein